MAEITTPRRFTVADVASELGMNEPAVRKWFRLRLFPEHTGHYWLTEEQFEQAVRVIGSRKRQKQKTVTQ